MLKPFFAAAVKPGGTLELSIYEQIGRDFFGDGVTAKSVKQQLDAAQFSRIAVRINSPGGDAFEGLAIGNLLRSTKKPIDVFVDGIAASAASIIAMAGHTRTMGANAMLMIHNAWTLCAGDGNDMRKMADTLDKISDSIAQTYMERTGKSLDDIKALMDAETWMSAQDAVDGGFATGITEESSEEAMALASTFAALDTMKHVPQELRNSSKSKTKKVDGEDLTWSDFIVASDHEDTSTWHLPWHFSNLEKTKAHLRDALARFNQVEGLSEDEKHAAWTKLVDLCKKYGIHVSEDNAADGTVRNDGDGMGGAEDGMCDCPCQNCMASNCMNCTAENCADENCMNCPMQMSAKAESNLSLYEARLKMLRAA